MRAAPSLGWRTSARRADKLRDLLRDLLRNLLRNMEPLRA
jgi:hypothetical protein